MCFVAKTSLDLYGVGAAAADAKDELSLGAAPYFCCNTQRQPTDKLAAICVKKRLPLDRRERRWAEDIGLVSYIDCGPFVVGPIADGKILNLRQRLFRIKHELLVFLNAARRVSTEH